MVTEERKLADGNLPSLHRFLCSAHVESMAAAVVELPTQENLNGEVRSFTLYLIVFVAI